MLKGKNIVMGVTGGIAAWKACLILNKLVIDLHANVDVIMTKNSETFITEQTFVPCPGTSSPGICSRSPQSGA